MVLKLYKVAVNVLACVPLAKPDTFAFALGTQLKLAGRLFPFVFTMVCKLTLTVPVQVTSAAGIIVLSPLTVGLTVTTTSNGSPGQLPAAPEIGVTV